MRATNQKEVVISSTVETATGIRPFNQEMRAAFRSLR
jgi:hypothetical protein